MKQVIALIPLLYLLCTCGVSQEAGEGIAVENNVEDYRPLYHLSPPEGWMGDPSGLVYHEGLYHFYYWRHATSRDLVNWQHHPAAFSAVDSIGQISGSVVVDLENTCISCQESGEPGMISEAINLKLS